MSLHHHKERIAKLLREQVEANAAGSLDALCREITRACGLDRSPDVQAELRSLIRELYDEYRRTDTFDYDDIVEQSFPASDPPPPPAP